METFKVTLKEHLTIIVSDANHFTVKVEKDRKLTEKDTGAIVETTLYKECSTFVLECHYVFEVIDKNHGSIFEMVHIELLCAAIDFFYHSILNTSYFIKSIPKSSCLYEVPPLTGETINDIEVSNLYELLSGY